MLEHSEVARLRRMRSKSRRSLSLEVSFGVPKFEGLKEAAIFDNPHIAMADDETSIDTVGWIDRSSFILSHKHAESWAIAFWTIIGAAAAADELLMISA